MTYITAIDHNTGEEGLRKTKQTLSEDSWWNVRPLKRGRFPSDEFETSTSVPKTSSKYGTQLPHHNQLFRM